LTLTLREAVRSRQEVKNVSYSVGEVARLAGVTVRTLHHYDDIGLLPVSARTAGGYRAYTEPDIARLQQIRSYRELGFGLDEIAEMLRDGDPLDHLRSQHQLLLERIDRLRQIAATVEKTMEARIMGIALNPEEMFEVFGEDDPTQYAEEVEQRWGDTPAYAESQRRTSRYTKDDWLRLKAQGAAAEGRMLQALRDGRTPDSTEAMDAAEDLRRHIDQWFYECSHAMHRGLGDMYIADPRFTAHYDDQEPGFAQFVRDAIHANADRAGA
jgi:DNA-binding transcriptional MerR regulator